MSSTPGGPVFSRRSFIQLLGVAGISIKLPQSLMADGPTLPLDETLPVGFEKVAANPNFATLRQRDRLPSYWNHNRTKLFWLEEDKAGDWRIMEWGPETPLEWADANEFYDVWKWRSWRTVEELTHYVRDGGQWIIRLTFRGTSIGMVPKTEKARVLAADHFTEENDFELTFDLDAAARFTSAQAIKVVPKLQALVAEYSEEIDMYYEPVRPEQAFKDLRLLQLRESGWAPEIGFEYSLKELEKLFQPGIPIVIPPNNPFVRVPDAWLCLMTPDHGVGTASLPDRDYFRWDCKCESKPDERSNEEPVDEDAEPKPCDCMPPELRSNETMIVAHIFQRKNARGKFVYLGLGHLPANQRTTSARFLIEPSIENPLYQSQWGDLTWRASLFNDDYDAVVNSRPLTSDAQIRLTIKELAAMDRGWLMIERWGPDALEIVVFEDRCAITYRYRECQRTNCQYLTNAKYEGDIAAEREFPDGSGEPVAARTILPRTQIYAVVRKFLAADGVLPSPKLWTEHPYGKPPEDTE